MHITFLPVLGTLRALYEMPRDMARFRRYLDEMLGGTDDVRMPITAANPMGREHCLQAVLALQAIDAEGAAARAAEEAARDLPDIGPPLRVFVCLLDDRMGGWTNRIYAEFENRYGSEQMLRANRRRRFAGVCCWTSETYTVEDVRRATRDALYRAVHWTMHGVPRTLREMLALDRRASRFCGEPGFPLERDELEYTHAVLEPLLDADDSPTCIAALFGDEAARACGYPPLGLSERAGQRLAMSLLIPNP
jgi:hypothetical protein